MIRTVTLSTGIVVTVKPLNPFFGTDAAAALRKKYPRPQPPMQTVDVMASLEPGVEPKHVQEPNRTNPEYLRELAQYNTMINTKAFEWSLEEACDVDIDEAKLAALKAKYQARGMELPDGDKLIYLTRVAIGSADDLTLIREAIQQLAVPTEEGIREKADGLKS